MILWKSPVCQVLVQQEQWYPGTSIGLDAFPLLYRTWLWLCSGTLLLTCQDTKLGRQNLTIKYSMLTVHCSLAFQFSKARRGPESFIASRKRIWMSSYLSQRAAPLHHTRTRGFWFKLRGYFGVNSITACKFCTQPNDGSNFIHLSFSLAFITLTFFLVFWDSFLLQKRRASCTQFIPTTLFQIFSTEFYSARYVVSFQTLGGLDIYDYWFSPGSWLNKLLIYGQQSVKCQCGPYIFCLISVQS